MEQDMSPEWADTLVQPNPSPHLQGPSLHIRNSLIVFSLSVLSFYLPGSESQLISSLYSVIPGK